MDNRVGILLRVTPEDKQAIEERMKTAGITNMNAYIETMALYGSIYNLREIGEVTRLLRYAGNNINQLLVLANSKGFFDKAALTAALEELREVDNLIFDAYTKS